MKRDAEKRPIVRSTRLDDEKLITKTDTQRATEGKKSDEVGMNQITEESRKETVDVAKRNKKEEKQLTNIQKELPSTSKEKVKITGQQEKDVT